MKTKINWFCSLLGGIPGINATAWCIWSKPPYSILNAFYQEPLVSPPQLYSSFVYIGMYNEDILNLARIILTQYESVINETICNGIHRFAERNIHIKKKKKKTSIIWRWKKRIHKGSTFYHAFYEVTYIRYGTIDRFASF